ncbi:MAG: MoaD family protein [Candidatus Bathyarchaeia archaeon]
MGKITVNLYGVIARIAGERKTVIEANTLREALKILSERYGKEFSERIYEAEDKVKRFLNIYINGKDIRFLNGLETVLNENDEVSIIPAVGGG